MKKYLTAFIIISTIVIACSKQDSGPDCPLQQYHIQCDYKEKDYEIGGYLTGTSYYYVELHCLSEAEDFANNISYTSEDTYKHCKVIP